jgi:hypothetical protein
MRNCGALHGEVQRPLGPRINCSAHGIDGIDWVYADKGYELHLTCIDVANGAIGGLDYTPEERKKIAAMYVLLKVFYLLYIRSREYTCPVCKIKNIDLLPDTDPNTVAKKSKDTPVVLSFGYKKDQSKSTSRNTSTPSNDPNDRSDLRYITDNISLS